MIKNIKITFDNKAKDFILDAFGKIKDKDGYVVERDNPKQKVLTPDGNELYYKDFAGIKNGSEIYMIAYMIAPHACSSFTPPAFLHFHWS